MRLRHRHGRYNPSLATRNGRAMVGFTLIELLIVIVIIGIIMSFIMIAAQDGVRRAQERATEALITKLSIGVSDRYQAILSLQVVPNQAHRVLGASYPSGLAGQPVGQSQIPATGSVQEIQNQRAAVIARYDMIKAELPDVFFLNTDGNSGLYPLNFAGVPYPAWKAAGSTFAPLTQYVLPMGNAVNANLGGAYQPNANPIAATDYPWVHYDLNYPINGTGIYGASYTAQAGIKKNLGFRPEGFDGADNNRDGHIDELAEGTLTISGAQIAIDDPEGLIPAGNFHVSDLVARNLSRHTHKTARSEMLYALLVEGQGPLGSVFDRDEFKDSEVGDTDGDGLPEFIDAWGQPLLFYRWPVLYGSTLGTALAPYDPSDSQKGGDGYGVFETRQQDAVDPNQTLMALLWWSTAFNNQPTYFGTTPQSTTDGMSAGATTFSALFHSLVDPAPGVTQPWDRSNATKRRAYYTRPLILSGGPDQQPGVLVLDDVTATQASAALYVSLVENQAGSFALADRHPATPSGLFTQFNSPNMLSQQSLDMQFAGGNVAPFGAGYANDDISSQNLQSPGMGVR